jgi:DNA-binding response OmpR family regulator
MCQPAILVFVHDAAIRRLLHLFLRRVDYDVVECATEVDARRALWESTWQIAVIDEKFLDGNTAALCDEIKSTAEFRNRYVISLAREELHERKIGLLELGVDDVLWKPFQFPEFLARIRLAQRIVNLQLELRDLSKQLSTTSFTKVFISYAHEDRSAAEKIYDALRLAGFQPWLDKRDLLPGDQWQRVIPRQIRASDAVVVCLSTSAINKRGYVQDEFKTATAELRRLPTSRRFIIPVRLDDCAVPEDFGALHYVDYTAPDFLHRLIISLRR